MTKAERLLIIDNAQADPSWKSEASQDLPRHLAEALLKGMPGMTILVLAWTKGHRERLDSWIAKICK
jgi:hypothetical protein